MKCGKNAERSVAICDKDTGTAPTNRGRQCIVRLSVLDRTRAAEEFRGALIPSQPGMRADCSEPLRPVTASLDPDSAANHDPVICRTPTLQLDSANSPLRHVG